LLHCRELPDQQPSKENAQTTSMSSQGSSNSATAATPPGGEVQNAEDLTVFVQSLLEQMQSRFQQMSDAIIGRIDEMGNRIDDLENSISELMEQAGVEDTEQMVKTQVAAEPAKASN